MSLVCRIFKKQVNLQLVLEGVHRMSELGRGFKENLQNEEALVQSFSMILHLSQGLVVEKFHKTNAVTRLMEYAKAEQGNAGHDFKAYSQDLEYG